MQIINLKKLLPYLFVLCFFILISLLTSNYIGFNRHWITNLDQEVTLAYNALLFNNGLKLEYFDHPGYFTILFLSFFLKFLHVINFLETDKLSLITIDNFNFALQNIIYYTRIYAALSVALFIFFTYLLFLKFSVKKLPSFFFSLIIFFSIGVLEHLSSLRTELWSMSFLILSLINLKSILEKNNVNRYLNLIGFFIFLYCSLLNKMQVIFYVPIILFLFFFLKQKIKKFNLSNFLFLKIKKINLIFFFTLLFYFYINNNNLHPFPILSFIFYLLNIGCINLFFFFIFKKNNNFFLYKDLNQNLAVINLTLIVTFFFLKSLLFIHPSTPEMIFTNLTRIMHMVQYINEIPDGNEKQLIASLVSKFLTSTYFFGKNFVSSFSVANIMFVSIIILNYLYLKKITKKIFYFNFACLVVYILIEIINMRGGNNVRDFYNIFSFIFLILPFLNFSLFLNRKYFFNVFIIFLIIYQFSIFLKKIDLKKYTIRNNYNFCSKADRQYLLDWHKKIDQNFINNFCKKN